MNLYIDFANDKMKDHQIRKTAPTIVHETGITPTIMETNQQHSSDQDSCPLLLIPT